MQFKPPKNDEKYYWTQHVVRKMMHYGLSADRVKRVIRAPERMETGIAEGTLAAMQPAGSKQKPQEIWVMYAEARKQNIKIKNIIAPPRKKVVISAWRYPGVSPVRGPIPIPEEVLAELKDLDVGAMMN